MFGGAKASREMLRLITEAYLECQKETITVSKEMAAFIEDCLAGRNMTDHTITYTAVFADGMQMDVKVCPCQGAYPFTEAVLFNKKGGEVCHSECEDHFFGNWVLSHNGRTYIATLNASKF